MFWLELIVLPPQDVGSAGCGLEAEVEGTAGPVAIVLLLLLLLLMGGACGGNGGRLHSTALQLLVSGGAASLASIEMLVSSPSFCWPTPHRPSGGSIKYKPPLGEEN